MISIAKYAGYKKYTSQKTGKKYGYIYVYPLLEDGNPDIEQMKIRTFSETVLEICDMLQPGESIVLDLSVKEILLQGVQRYEES